MILVFYASLAPRGYGRTSPRSPRVYLPFVAILPGSVAFGHPRSLVCINPLPFDQVRSIFFQSRRP